MREFLGKSVQVMTSWDYIVSKMKPQKDEFTIVISHRGKKGLTEKVLKCLKNQPHLLLANENASHAGHPFIAVSPEEGSCAHTQSLFGAMGVISELTAQAADAAAAKKLRTQKKELTSLLDELLKEVFRSGMGCEFSSKISRHIYFVEAGPFTWLR